MGNSNPRPGPWRSPRSRPLFRRIGPANISLVQNPNSQVEAVRRRGRSPRRLAQSGPHGLGAAALRSFLACPSRSISRWIRSLLPPDLGHHTSTGRNMPTLFVKCRACGQEIPTPVAEPTSGVAGVMISSMRVRCPKCGHDERVLHRGLPPTVGNRRPRHWRPRGGAGKLDQRTRGQVGGRPGEASWIRSRAARGPFSSRRSIGHQKNPRPLRRSHLTGFGRSLDLAKVLELGTRTGPQRPVRPVLPCPNSIGRTP